MRTKKMSKDAIDNNLRQVIRDLTRRISALERQQQDVGQLSELSSDMGLQTAGEFRAGNGVEPGEGFSGVRMTADGVSGYDNDVLQSQMSATDGKITAGAGDVTIDADGIEIIGDSSGAPGAYKIIDDSGNTVAELRGYVSNNYSVMSLYSTGQSTSDGALSYVSGMAASNMPSLLTLTAQSGTAQSNIVIVRDSNPETVIGNYIGINNGGEDVDTIIRDSDGSASVLVCANAGSKKVGIGTAAPDEKLDVRGNIIASGYKLIMGATGAITGGAETINDDAAFSFTPVTSRGVLILRSGGAQSTIFGMFTFAAVAGTAYCYSWVVGSATVAATGALSGTTGTDTKVTVSAHTDGKIYIENRSGGQQPFAWQIVAGA
jgi:hypothetical protein